MANIYDRHDTIGPNGSGGSAHPNGAALYPPGAQTTGIDQLRETLHLLWRHKWTFLAVAVVVAAGVAAYTYSLPKVYRTSSLLLVEPDQGAQDGQINLQMQGVGQRQETALANEMLVINQSNELARRVAKRLMEMETVPQTDEPLQILHTPTGKRRSMEAVAGRLMSKVSARS
ncbi:MAG: hypothetical protein BRD40_03810, partial [Bacteroidetes bacterium QS_1_65_9]